MNLKLTTILTILFCAIANNTALAQTPKDALHEGFKNPPSHTKPWVYWYWMSDHISADGITKDLEAMAEVGIGEALIGNIDQINEKGDVKALTDEWHQMIGHAIKEGKRLGIDIGLFNAPGWSQSGGPWIQPEHSMRYLASSELKVTGPQKLKAITKPPHHKGFQKVATIAFPAPKNHDRHLLASNAIISSTPTFENIATLFDGNKELLNGILMPNTQIVTIDMAPSSPFEARSLTLYPAKTSFKATGELQSQLPDGQFKTITTFLIDRTNNSTSVGFIPFGPICETFPAASSTHFRLVFKDIKGEMGLAEVELSAQAKTERYIEKQLAKLWPTPAPQWDAYMWNEQPALEMGDLAINPKEVVNISSYTNSDGQLEWEVPSGDWIIQQIGMVPTGQKNAPASPEATGLEVDKMNKEWVETHFDAYIGNIYNKIETEDKPTLKHIVADSYETGAQNWTDGMADAFRERYHYDPIAFLPVLWGHVVGSADLSDRFLWDLRRYIADRISYEYVGTLREKSNAIGTKLWLENYGHWGYPGEFLQYGGQSDEIGGEFWTGNDNEGLELRAASSAAHGYGKNVVHAEAFTSGGPMWQHEPRNLKKLGDWAATKGINHFILHVYIHQAYENKVPGINAWFGIEFNRHNTWFYQSKGWIDYLRRCHFMLEQGHYVADIAYFIGEDAPKMTGIRQPELPEGYNFDYVNAEMIGNMVIKDNKYTLPDGMSYKALVLPPQSTMRPETLLKIKKLVSDGGVLVGPAPQRSPSLENFPQCDEQVKTMAQEMWGSSTESAPIQSKFGKGIVFNNLPLSKILAELQLPADIENIESDKYPWTHRQSNGTDIYFISNQTDQKANLTPTFRVDGMQPELWDPVTQEQRILPNFEDVSGRTKVTIELEPSQAVFIVFRSKTTNQANSDEPNFMRKKKMMAIDGDWTVLFKKTEGNGLDTIIFHQLQDWTQKQEPNIKFYSGTARYTKSFDVKKIPGNTPVYINLGRFNALANVRLNGNDIGLVWAYPTTVDVSSYLKKEGNVLEVDITNTWHNRLVGDAQLPADQRTTHATLYPGINEPLMPSGLIGPVTLEIPDPDAYAQKVEIRVGKTVLTSPDSTTVDLWCPTNGAIIYYTLDGSVPTKKSAKYTGPLTVYTQSTISAIAIKKGMKQSEISYQDIDVYNAEANGLNHIYYEGNWNSLPDFNTIKAIKNGKGSMDIGAIKNRDDHFAIRFDGFINIRRQGNYTFFLSSDDGSKLYINDNLVVDNDGSHGKTEKSGTVNLGIGKHRIVIEYFDNINDEALELDYQIEGDIRKTVHPAMVTFD